MNKTLISPAEAIRFSPVGADFPASQVFGQIRAEELDLFVEYIGEDFYYRLVADLVEYSGTPEWNGGPYAKGENVMEAGVVYTSLVADNEEPIGDPLNASAWKEADKFATPCFNSLWVDGFLREFLAYSVILASLPFATYPTGALGPVEKYEDATGVRTAGNPNYSKIVDQLERGKHQRLRLVLKYMTDNAVGCDFTGAFCVSTSFGGVPTPGRTRRTFYR